LGSVLEVGVYPIRLPKDSASLSSTAKPSHRTAPHRRADQAWTRFCGPSARVVCDSAIYKDKDEVANRGGLPTLRDFVFFRGNAKIRGGYPGSPPSCTGRASLHCVSRA
jgi:hypothetical protein